MAGPVKAFGVENLRSIGDTGFIRLRPINILLGKNGSGKSSFARILPLGRQSVERRKTKPLLWWGRFVDFGSFSEAVSQYDNSTDQPIRLKFEIEADRQTRYPVGPFRKAFSTISPLSIQVTLTLRPNPALPDEDYYAESVDLAIDGNIVCLQFSNDLQLETITINNKIVEQENLSRIPVTQGALLPILSGITSLSTRKQGTVEDHFILEYLGFLREHAHGRTTDERLIEVGQKLGIGDQETVINYISNTDHIPTVLKRHLCVALSNITVWKRFQRSQLLAFLPGLIEHLDECLYGFFQSVTYIEPIRASADRYYRRQDLAIDEVDSKGENLAMFIAGLPHNQRRDLREWLYQQFGFVVELRASKGHQSLYIKESELPNAVNVADMGFGYSQMLPILVQTWWMIKRRRQTRHVAYRLMLAGKFTNFVIEQPELHLHPAFQTKLADMFTDAYRLASSSKPPKVDVSFIVETHSEALVSRIGELVSEGRLDPSEVSILLFERSEKTGRSSLREINFTEDGYLSDWPYGFFSG